MFFTVKKILEEEDQTKSTHLERYLIHIETSDLIQTNQGNDFCWDTGLKQVNGNIVYIKT